MGFVHLLSMRNGCKMVRKRYTFSFLQKKNTAKPKHFLGGYYFTVDTYLVYLHNKNDKNDDNTTNNPNNSTTANNNKNSSSSSSGRRNNSSLMSIKANMRINYRKRDNYETITTAITTALTITTKNR